MTNDPNMGDRRGDARSGYAAPDGPVAGATAAGAGEGDLDEHGRHRDPDATVGRREDAHAIAERERQEYGGVKIGSAFFGWLTATGMFVLLSALLSAAGAAIGLAQTDSVGDAAETVTEGAAETITVVTAILLLLVLFLAYYAGGYVAGRMARFDGLKQGAAVWGWAIVIAVVLAVIGAVAGSEYDVLAGTGALPRVPVNEGDLTTVGIIAAVIALAVSLAGALLGGKSGEHYHRKVDQAGVGLR